MTARSQSGSASVAVHYASPTWSPRGDLIAFTRIGGGAFRIGVMSPAEAASDC